MSHVPTVAAMFGLRPNHALRKSTRRKIPILPGRVTLLAGDSGAGKSTLLQKTAAKYRAANWEVIDVGAIPLDAARPLIDTFEHLALPDILATLSRAGLAEAALLCRPATQLSAGEQFRYRLAQALALAARQTSPALLIADEFAAVLDRVTARVVSFGLRKQIARTSIAALVATTHDDLSEDLSAVTIRL